MQVLVPVNVQVVRGRADNRHKECGEGRERSLAFSFRSLFSPLSLFNFPHGHIHIGKIPGPSLDFMKSRGEGVLTQEAGAVRAHPRELVLSVGDELHTPRT